MTARLTHPSASRSQCQQLTTDGVIRARLGSRELMGRVGRSRIYPSCVYAWNRVYDVQTWKNASRQSRPEN